jgi:hypothetical protein
MAKMLGFTTLVVSVLIFVPALQGQRKDGKNNVIKATPQDYKVLERVKEITGIIAFTDPNSKELALRVDFPQVQLAKGRGNNRYKRPQFTVVHNYKEFELDVENAVVVRKMFIAIEYDDKGNIKGNEEQTKELRSKGYITAKYDDIRSGNVAKLVLKPPQRDKNVAGAGNVARPTVRTIVLLQEGKPLAMSKGAEKKKKN